MVVMKNVAQEVRKHGGAMRRRLEGDVSSSLDFHRRSLCGDYRGVCGEAAPGREKPKCLRTSRS